MSDILMNMATAWIIAGTFTFVWHNVYVWDGCSEWFKREVNSASFFVCTIVLWPGIAFILLLIMTEVAIELKRWKRENGYD